MLSVNICVNIYYGLSAVYGPKWFSAASLECMYRPICYHPLNYISLSKLHQWTFSRIFSFYHLLGVVHSVIISVQRLLLFGAMIKFKIPIKSTYLLVYSNTMHQMGCEFLSNGIRTKSLPSYFWRKNDEHAKA